MAIKKALKECGGLKPVPMLKPEKAENTKKKKTDSKEND